MLTNYDAMKLREAAAKESYEAKYIDELQTKNLKAQYGAENLENILFILEMAYKRGQADGIDAAQKFTIENPVIKVKITD